MAGISMAGFRVCGEETVGMRVMPHPAVTVGLEFGACPLVVDRAAARQQRSDLVAGFGHVPVRVRGENIECVEVRLSPLVAPAVLGTPLPLS
ncbi:hypothetical protein [Streptomyces chrestomyceticus]|uniref:hypothetical protein n=1 Tax=Streptomyces chrestomyceticus TaxID=68185 RepID=UPI0033D940FA